VDPPILIRPATTADFPAVWTLLEPTIRAGETFALPRDLGEAAAIEYWTAPGHEVFVAEAGGCLVGTYFLCANRRWRRGSRRQLRVHDRAQNAQPRDCPVVMGSPAPHGWRSTSPRKRAGGLLGDAIQRRGLIEPERRPSLGKPRLRARGTPTRGPALGPGRRLRHDPAGAAAIGRGVALRRPCDGPSGAHWRTGVALQSPLVK
jgi:hypothetical protein